VGTWDALWHISEQNTDGNVLRGDVVVDDVSDSLIYSGHRLVTALGMANCIIVDTDDAVLIADKNRAQDIKQLVAKLGDRQVIDLHSKVYRPWGSYQGVDSGERFQVKRIIVNPGAALSLQMHHHRAEHWIVVRGTAQVTRGEETFMLTEDQSTYIPLGTTHRLENPGSIPLELIEVQSGSYLGEDDIVRFEDQYGR
jgi:mannose-1-phosphate guanylyltransferase/mannose-6-phosphate isomerase